MLCVIKNMIYNKNLLTTNKFELNFYFDIKEDDFVTAVMVTCVTLNLNYSKPLVLHNIQIVSREWWILFNEFIIVNLSVL